MRQLHRPELPPGALADLVRELHVLHTRAGRPSMRDLARGQRFSYTAVYDLFTKTITKAPRLPLLLTVVEQLATLAPRMNVEEVLDKFDALWVAADRQPFPAAEMRSETAPGDLSITNAAPSDDEPAPDQACPEGNAEVINPDKTLLAATPPAVSVRRMPDPNVVVGIGRPPSAASAVSPEPAPHRLRRRTLLVAGGALAPLVGLTTLTRSGATDQKIEAGPTSIGSAPATQGLAPTSGDIERIFSEHTAPVFAVATAQLDEKPVVISGSGDKTVKVWSLTTGELVAASAAGQLVPPVNKSAPVLAVATDTRRTEDGRDQRVVISSGDDNTVQVWELATGNLIYSLSGPKGSIRAIKTAPVNGQTAIIAGSDDRSVWVWNLDDGQMVKQLPIVPPPSSVIAGIIESVAATEFHQKSIVISGGYDGIVQVSDVNGGPPVSPVLPGPVYALATAVLKGRLVIIAGGAERIVRAWYLEDGRNTNEHAIMAHSAAVRAVATTQLNRNESVIPVIISVGNDKMVRVWNLADASPIGKPFTGHSGNVNTVAIGQLGEKAVIITGSDDNTVRVWDLAARTNM